MFLIDRNVIKMFAHYNTRTKQWPKRLKCTKAKNAMYVYSIAVTGAILY